MIRNIITLTLNDLAIAFKNKTIYIIFFIPLFVFLSLKLVDQKDSDFRKIKIGLIQKEKYSPVIIKSIRAADKVFTIFWISDEYEGTRWLKEKKIDGLLIKSEKKPQNLELLVLTKASIQTIAIVESFSALQIAAEGKNNFGHQASPGQRDTKRDTADLDFNAGFACQLHYNACAGCRRKREKITSRAPADPHARI